MGNKTQIIAVKDKLDFQIVRTFSASNKNVFRAFVEPDLFVQWYMPKEMMMSIEKMDCQTGGSYYHTHKHLNGMSFGFKGVYHEVENPNQICKTSEFIGLSHKVEPVLEITKFENCGNDSTKVIIHTLCISNEYRNALIQNGMEQHLKLSHQLLDELLNNLK